MIFNWFRGCTFAIDTDLAVTGALQHHIITNSFARKLQLSNLTNHAHELRMFQQKVNEPNLDLLLLSTNLITAYRDQPAEKCLPAVCYACQNIEICGATPSGARSVIEQPAAGCNGELLYLGLMAIVQDGKRTTPVPLKFDLVSKAVCTLAIIFGRIEDDSVSFSTKIPSATIAVLINTLRGILEGTDRNNGSKVADALQALSCSDANAVALVDHGILDVIFLALVQGPAILEGRDHTFTYPIARVRDLLASVSGFNRCEAPCITN